MKLSSLGEFGVIRSLRRSFSRTSPRVVRGIGDDAAVLSCPPSTTLLATTDMLIEGVHFDLEYTDFRSLGWKSAAANLSDIAAMGGAPRFCLTALALPSDLSSGQLAEFFRGIKHQLRRHDTDLVGGDTCRSPEGLIIISITLLGEIEKGGALLRSGARPGDRIFVTGTLGDSAAGLELLRSGECGVRKRTALNRKVYAGIKRLVERHLRPEPRVEWGRTIALSGCATAMIDVSDGLSSDLGHLCEESGVGAEVSEERIPLSPGLRSVTGLKDPPLRYALSGGEDYELLFTVPPSKVSAVARLGIDATEIGTVTKGRRMTLRSSSGRRTPFAATGYDHFPRSGTGRRKRRRGDR